MPHNRNEFSGESEHTDMGERQLNELFSTVEHGWLRFSALSDSSEIKRRSTHEELVALHQAYVPPKEIKD